MEEKPEGALAPRGVKDAIQEKLFDMRRDLFCDLSAVFIDTTSLSFYGVPSRSVLRFVDASPGCMMLSQTHEA